MTNNLQTLFAQKRPSRSSKKDDDFQAPKARGRGKRLIEDADGTPASSIACSAQDTSRRSSRRKAASNSDKALGLAKKQKLPTLSSAVVPREEQWHWDGEFDQQAPDTPQTFSSPCLVPGSRPVSPFKPPGRSLPASPLRSTSIAIAPANGGLPESQYGQNHLAFVQSQSHHESYLHQNGLDVPRNLLRSASSSVLEKHDPVQHFNGAESVHLQLMRQELPQRTPALQPYPGKPISWKKNPQLSLPPAAFFEPIQFRTRIEADDIISSCVSDIELSEVVVAVQSLIEDSHEQTANVEEQGRPFNVPSTLSVGKDFVDLDRSLRLKLGSQFEERRLELQSLNSLEARLPLPRKTFLDYISQSQAPVKLKNVPARRKLKPRDSTPSSANSEPVFSSSSSRSTSKMDRSRSFVSDSSCNLQKQKPAPEFLKPPPRISTKLQAASKARQILQSDLENLKPGDSCLSFLRQDLSLEDPELASFSLFDSPEKYSTVGSISDLPRTDSECELASYAWDSQAPSQHHFKSLDAPAAFSGVPASGFAAKTLFPEAKFPSTVPIAFGSVDPRAFSPNCLEASQCLLQLSHRM